jgi:protein O-mannosyl-transferase
MSSPSDSRLHLQDAAAAFGLVVLVIAVYAGVFQHSFLLNWDDLTYVVDNEAIRGFTWANVSAIFGRSYFGNYAPLHILSYSVDHAVWGLRPGGFLFTNVLLHALNGVLVYALLVRLGITRVAALLGAVVFLLHPVQVESVAWVSERKNLLSMAFFLAALHAYASYRFAESSGRRARAYVASCLAYGASLLAKATSVILAPLLLLFDVCYVRPESRRHWMADKIPFVAGAVAITFATLASQSGAIAEGREVFAMDGASTLYTMVPVVAQYIGMLVWPADLSALYTPPIRQGPDLAFEMSTVLLFAIGLGGYLLFRKNRRLFFWYATFFLGLVPVLHVVPLPTLMNDRYLYFPMLGAAGFFAMVAEVPLRGGVWSRRAVLMSACALLAALGIASRARAEVWRDDLSLWQDVVAKTPRSSLALIGLGVSLSDAGRRDEALPVYLKALAIDPYHPLALNNVGVLYNLRGLPDLGRPYLLRAVQVAPDYFEAYMNLGIGYRSSGDFAAAAGAFEKALLVRPGAADASRALRDAQARIQRGVEPR